MRLRELLLAAGAGLGAALSAYQGIQVQDAQELRLTAIQGLASALAECERRSDTP